MSTQPKVIPTGKDKLFGTTFIVLISGFWSILVIAMYWEIVSLKCSPNPVDVICKISGEPNPGETRILEIPKAQLAKVEIIDRQRKGQYRIGLTRNFSGDATIQLEQQLDQIAAFIADPTATSLNIETRRNFPPSIWIISAVIFGFSGWCLKRLWIGHKL
jgi:hypothetical protein